MKCPIFVLVGLFAAFSCTRTNNPPTSPTSGVGDSLLQSYTIYSPGAHIRQVQVFSFDKNSQLASLHSTIYDSTLSWSPEVDSISIAFALTGSATPPPFYDIIYYYSYSPPGGLQEHHALYYDNQNRVVRDSIASGNNGTNNTSVHFSYDPISTVGVNVGYSPTPGVSATDSMRIDSDNITFELRYTPPFASVGNRLMHSYSYMYSGYLNPLYNQAFARSLGCTLFFHGFEDFRSKNLPVDGIKTDFYTNSDVELQYTWTTDSIGRVIRGVALDGHSNVYQIYSYKYESH